MKKKTICLFSRLELTNLYGRIGANLLKDFDIIHLAYSNNEAETLKSVYGVQNVIVFKDRISEILVSRNYEKIDLNEIDELFINESTGRFSLNSSIRYDRSFQHMKYSDCLHLAKVYFMFWMDFIKEYKIDFLFHEPPAVFMTHVAANICKKLGAFYLSQSQVAGVNEFDWIFIEGDFGSPIEWNKYKNQEISTEDLANVENYIKSFRSKYQTFFVELSGVKKKRNSNVQFFYSLMALIKYSFINSSNIVNSDILINHYDTYQKYLKKPFFLELYNIWYRAYKMNYAEINSDDTYYFYPLHAEPEAAVLYRGDGIYEGQVKLIENIAEQLPPGVLLYVKDHPHRSAFSDMFYLERLKRIPNLKLIDPNISGKLIISNAKGVITISGTAGYEAIILNKPVFLFGQAFYMLSDRVNIIKNIRDLRSEIYKSEMKTFADEKGLIQFVSTLLKISHNGFIAYFPSHIKKIQINHDINCKIVSDEIKIALNGIVKSNVNQCNC
jgi:hypothetical protein